MELWLDTAEIAEIEAAASWGVLGGVTTNPTLVARAGHRDVERAVRRICELVDGPVSVEVISEDREGMVEEALRYSSWAPNVVVKLPITPPGLAAARECGARGIRTNLTLCFSVNQGVLAALAGATYVSPFVGRLDDVGQDGMALVADLVQVFRAQGMGTRVVAASIRHPLHVVQAARVGAHVVTVPHAVLVRMVSHPLTDLGIERFLKDWESLQRSGALTPVSRGS